MDEESSGVGCEIDATKINSEIVFNSEPGIWIMKISRSGILFNREAYPISQPDG